MSTVTEEVNPRLRQLTEAGVSVWLDQISRTLVAGGELARMVAQESLRGVTSNPAIFEKAIIGTTDYDEQIAERARDGRDAKAIFEAVAVADVQRACDTLAGVHGETGGRDGFVSLEVMPNLARDTNGTLAAARDYWQRVARPNAMIKIPGTPAGVPAIEQAIYEGINVNVTLLFAVDAYAGVAEAYLRGLERRHAEGRPLDVNSVASFFVSRVDTNVDKKLTALGGDAMRLGGTAALANARAAYARFKEIFAGPRWEGLAAAGAAVQRPLWASTGVKNPNYADTMYVDQLIAPHTVNTMPLATLHAVADHGTVPGNTAEEDPAPALAALADAGIDLGQVTDELLAEGIKLFEDAMTDLLDGIEERRQAVLTGRPPTVQASIPSELSAAVAARIEGAAKAKVADRVWKHDVTLWGVPGTPEIENRLGWLTVSETMLEHATELEHLRTELLSEGYTDAVLLGMGGSSLGPEVIRRTFGDPRPGEGLKLHVLDSTHPDVVLAVQDSVEVAKTVFVVSSKSGGTIETLSHYKYFAGLATTTPEQFIVVTDPGSPLAELAERDGLRRSFLNPPEIGGRYSVMSYFGIVPAALMGVPVVALLHRCQVGEQQCAQLDSSQSNPALWVGAALGELARRGHDKVTFIVSPPIESFGLWVEQLIAESTGKQGRGVLPVADEPLAEPASYGPDRVFAYLRNTEHTDERLDQAVKALAEAGQPTVTFACHGAADLGRLFFLAEFATAVAGWALEINPFDQPNVQEAKDKTKAVLDAGSVPSIAPAGDEELRKLLADAKPPHYVAILAYLPMSDQLDAAVAELRSAIRAAGGAATTFGYGPRFQHSTGQLHKGGPPTGRFLQLVDTSRRDVEIPGAGYSFGTLIASQAAGDLQTLRDHGLPAERVALAGDPAAAVRALAQRITELLKEG